MRPPILSLNSNHERENNHMPLIPTDKNGDQLAWPDPDDTSGRNWVDAWNGTYSTRYSLINQLVYWCAPEEERVLAYGEAPVDDDEFDRRRNAGDGPHFDRDDRVMVMAGTSGYWKVELWAPTGGDSITLADGFVTREGPSGAEQWADAVRDILKAWDDKLAWDMS